MADRTLHTYYADVKQELTTGVETGITVPDGFSDDSFRLNPFVSETNTFMRDQLIDEKSAPDDLHTMITDREKVGAMLFVVEKHTPTNSWFVKYKTNDFFLTSMTMNLKEKVQVLETFGTSLVSFFGDAVKIYEFSGIAMDWTAAPTSSEYDLYYDEDTGKHSMINTRGEVTEGGEAENIKYSNPKNFWQTSLIHMYNNILRGTQLVKHNRVALLSVGTHYVYGYPLNFGVNYSAQTEKFSSFSMSWVVLDHTLGFEDIQEDDFEKNYKFNYEYAPIGSSNFTSDIRLPKSFPTLN